jgi:hypothetical protein
VFAAWSKAGLDGHGGEVHTSLVEGWGSAERVESTGSAARARQFVHGARRLDVKTGNVDKEIEGG